MPTLSIIRDLQPHAQRGPRVSAPPVSVKHFAPLKGRKVCHAGTEARPPRVNLTQGTSRLLETWLENQIAENPARLNLGEVEVRGRQRMQPRAGRLDLLLEDTENRKRYEVEIQLGKTDESHIIRAIEYWTLNGNGILNTSTARY